MRLEETLLKLDGRSLDRRRSGLALSVANQIAEAALACATAERGTASFCGVSEGSCPTSNSLRLSPLVSMMLHVDWARVKITLVDDRQVPVSHDDSNCKWIRSRLLKGQVVAALISATDGSRTSLKCTARPFDVMLLGMGLRRACCLSYFQQWWMMRLRI